MLILRLSVIHTLRSSLNNPRIECTKVEFEVCTNNPRIVRIRSLRITYIHLPQLHLLPDLSKQYMYIQCTFAACELTCVHFHPATQCVYPDNDEKNWYREAHRLRGSQAHDHCCNLFQQWPRSRIWLPVRLTRVSAAQSLWAWNRHVVRLVVQ